MINLIKIVVISRGLNDKKILIKHRRPALLYPLFVCNKNGTRSNNRVSPKRCGKLNYIVVGEIIVKVKKMQHIKEESRRIN